MWLGQHPVPLSSGRMDVKYFLDTEFIDKGLTLDVISVGLVAEDGREYYAISTEFDPSRANAMVRAEVLPALEPTDSGLWKPLRRIRDELAVFTRGGAPEFWTWGGGAFDWLAILAIFGSSDNFPDGWPYGPFDLDQWLRQLEIERDDPRLPTHPGRAHHALADARHNRLAYEFLACYQRTWILEQARLASPPSPTR